MAEAACCGVVKVFVDWWRRGERAAIVAAVGVPLRCWGGGGATPARRGCWGRRGAAGVLQCWRGGGGALVAGTDDGGVGCAVRTR